MNSWNFNTSATSSSGSVSFADDFEFSKVTSWHCGEDNYKHWEEYVVSPPVKPRQQQLIQKPRPSYAVYETMQQAPEPEEVLTPVPEANPLPPQVSKFDEYIETLSDEEKEVANEIKRQFESGSDSLVLPASSVTSFMIPLPSSFGDSNSGLSGSFVFDKEACNLKSLRADKKTSSAQCLDIPDWPAASAIQPQEEIMRKKRTFDDVLSSLKFDDNEATRCFGQIVGDALKEKPAQERITLAEEIWKLVNGPAVKKSKMSV